MTTDLELERLLRETFGTYADTVTDGPRWRGAEAEHSTAATPLALAETTPRSGASEPLFPDSPMSVPRPPDAASRRWRIPAIAAASVAVLALATAVLAPRVAHWTAHPAAEGGPSMTADAPAGAGDSVPPDAAATVGPDGAITVAAGDPGLVLDLYVDALCPICGEFERTNGEAIERAIDDGQLAVRYRFVDFLNAASASGDYSTRAYAALLTVARQDGGEPGVFLRFHAALFDPAHQPVEQSAHDLSNADLASLAGSVGASAAAQADIASGAGVAEAHTLASAALDALTAVAETAGRAPGVPTVAFAGTPVNTNSPGWLAGLLARPTR